MPLTDLKIRTAGPGKYSDGHGLILEVRKTTGVKLWRYRYRIAGRENTYALGEFCRAPNNESDQETAERMKMRGEHLVPLSRQSVRLLRELCAYSGDREHLFPNQRNPRPYIGGTTLARALQYMGFANKGGKGFSPHGFRATASTVVNEAGFNPDLIEKQLSHAERNQVRVSYNHAQRLAERAARVQAWADLIDGIAAGKGKVTPMKRARRRG